MRVFRHFTELPASARGAVVAIGNFDGIHRGHQAIIGEAARLARAQDAPLAVLTFEPHPRSFFRPELAPFRLTPFRLKTRLIEALGVDVLVVLTFDEALSRLTADEFAADVLAKGLGIRHAVVGDNFAFGHKRGGTVATLEALGERHDFAVSCLSRVRGPGGEIYSSTRVRDYLQAGNPTRAALLLGRYWEIEGRVNPGDRRGRTLGMPTANLSLEGYLEPARGVYAVRAGLDRGAAIRWHDGVANLGVRPMFDGKTSLLEAHLFDFAQDIYGQHLRVALVELLRPEMTFESIDALVAQMADDARRARVILAAEHWERGWPAPSFGPAES
jgi:riboflavin kinase/FMN adenylyltransferase